MWERTARKRAKRGAAHFDKVAPGWFMTIDAESLDVHSRKVCPFAQVIMKGEAKPSDLPSERWGFRHGFVAVKGSNCYHINNAWRQEIKDRRDAIQAELDAPATMPAGLAESIMRHPSSG